MTPLSGSRSRATRPTGGRRQQAALGKNGDRAVTAERERAVHDDVAPAAAGDVRDDVQVALGIGRLVPDCRWIDTCLESEQAADRLQRARRPHAVSKHALHARNGDAAFAEDLAY